MKYLFVITIILASAANVFSQGDPDPQQQQQQQQFLQSKNVATALSATTYQRAMRYNDYNVAKNALYNLVSMYPQNDSLLYSLSVLYFQLQQYPSAALTAQDVMTLNPNHTGAMEVAAVSFQQIGAKDKAIDAYEDLYLNTENYQSLYQMAFLQYEVGRLQESLTNVNILMDKPETEELTVTFTTANNEQKQYPIRAALYNLKGLVMAEQGKIPDAKIAYNQALEIAPDFTRAKENLEKLN